MTTTIENHGFSVQASDRVQRVLHAVDRPNFKTTLDIGNFMCVDENPIIGVMKNIPYASLVHFKDFYFRPYDEYPGKGSGSPQPMGISCAAQSWVKVTFPFVKSSN